MNYTRYLKLPWYAKPWYARLCVLTVLIASSYTQHRFHDSWLYAWMTGVLLTYIGYEAVIFVYRPRKSPR